MSMATVGAGGPPLCPSPGAVDRPQNKIYERGGMIYIGAGDTVRLAMTQRRIRIGCTEISVEAARRVMELHGERFGKPTEETWQDFQ